MPVESHAFLDSQGVHSELCQYIYENFRPTISERELSARVRIVQEIESFIQQTMPEAYLTLFGSSRNGFSLEKADLDICLKYKNKEGIDESMDVKDIIVGISRILEEHRDISDVQAIASAKVPIVKFHHDPFGVDGDISLYNVLAEHNTAMLKVYSLIDERVVHLGAAFKQYVKLCDMGDASRGSLSSYAYIVMLIHYLQKENVVPVLQALPPVGHPPGEELPKVMIDGWNAYYFEDVDRLGEVWPLLGTNKKTVGQLWLGLIDYYATKFRFDHHVVCIRQLEPLSRLEKMWTNKPLCIEDPFELDHNLGTGISGKMAKYIFSALITSRNWFLRTPERAFSSPAAIYKHFMNLRELAVGKPPKDRGCKRCGKIGHWIKACPVKQGEATADKKSNRRVCHACGKPGHIVKECPTRLKQIRTPKDRPHQQQQLAPQQQQQDNRFPVNSFSSTDQTRPTISQNDMTSPSAHSSAARGEGTSAAAPEVKTDLPNGEMLRIIAALESSCRAFSSQHPQQLSPTHSPQAQLHFQHHQQYLQQQHLHQQHQQQQLQFQQQFQQQLHMQQQPIQAQKQQQPIQAQMQQQPIPAQTQQSMMRSQMLTDNYNHGFASSWQTMQPHGFLPQEASSSASPPGYDTHLSSQAPPGFQTQQQRHPMPQHQFSMPFPSMSSMFGVPQPNHNQVTYLSDLEQSWESQLNQSNDPGLNRMPQRPPPPGYGNLMPMSSFQQDKHPNAVPPYQVSDQPSSESAARSQMTWGLPENTFVNR